ncbi:MAG: HD domain-containing protein [Coprobacillus sp.]
MKQYEMLKDIFYKTIEDKSHGMYKKEAYFHSLQVSTICQYLANQQNIDIEIAGIIGLFHDYSTYISQTSFDHAHRSSLLVEDILKELQCDEQDIKIIITAIKNHSDKNKIDDCYSELIKDADVLAQYLQEPSKQFNEDYQTRLKNYL